jgi:vancomycin resistance protein VanW
MKKLIPSEAKVKLRVFQRYVKDLLTGELAQLAKFNRIEDEQKQSFKPQFCISQAILPTQYSENKKHNLNLAIQRIEDVVINPGEVFSFWHLVGKPDRAKGYREGRSLVGNQLKAEYGGGLCQLSGLLYFLTLKAGFPTLERYAHSHDIYTEVTRFSPLGSDATVVYGYKDFRFQNHLSFPIFFRFDLQDHEISALLCTPQPVHEYKIEFLVEEYHGGVKVDTVRFIEPTHSPEVLASNIYEKFN